MYVPTQIFSVSVWGSHTGITPWMWAVSFSTMCTEPLKIPTERGKVDSEADGIFPGRPEWAAHCSLNQHPPLCVMEKNTSFQCWVILNMRNRRLPWPALNLGECSLYVCTEGRLAKNRAGDVGKLYLLSNYISYTSVVIPPGNLVNIVLMPHAYTGASAQTSSLPTLFLCRHLTSARWAIQHVVLHLGSTKGQSKGQTVSVKPDCSDLTSCSRTDSTPQPPLSTSLLDSGFAHVLRSSGLISFSSPGLLCQELPPPCCRHTWFDDGG